MLIAKFECGSRLFVDDPRDKDLVILVDDKRDADVYFRENADRDVHLRTVEEEGSTVYGLYCAQLVREGKLKMLEGTYPVAPDDEKLLELAIGHRSFLPNLFFAGTRDKAVKSFYYVLLVYFYFENGNTGLTEAQRAEIERAHGGLYGKAEAYRIRERLVAIGRSRFGR